MKNISPTIFGFIAVLLCSIGYASDTPQEASAVDQNINFLSDAQMLNFHRSVLLCGSMEASDSKAIESAFERYMSNYIAGTSAGFLEVNRTVKLEPPSEDIKQGKFLEMRIKQSDLLLKATELNPTVVCRKLIEIFNSSSAELFQRSIEANYKQYQEKRKELCAKADSPKNCKQ